MSTSRAVPKVAILGHVGNKNLGDEAIIASVIQNVGARYAEADLIAFVTNPEDTRQRHGIPAFPVRRPAPAPAAGPTQEPEPLASGAWFARSKEFAKSIPVLGRLLRAVYQAGVASKGLAAEIAFTARSLQTLRGTSLLIVAGSGQLCDHFGGPWGFPFTLFRWALLARLAGAKVAFCSNGAGPINRPLSRFFLRSALRLAHYHSYRDHTSRQLVESMGIRANNRVVPDLAYGLQLARPMSERAATDRIVVGLNPLPFYGSQYWHVSNDDKYTEYVAKLAEFSTWLFAHGHAVVPFATQLKADPSVIQDIRSQMSRNGGAAYVRHFNEAAITGVDDLVMAIDRADVVVATRYHGVLISYLRNKPVIGIAYQQKTADLMADVVQGEFVLDAEKFDVAALVNCLQHILREREAIRASLRQNVMGAKLAVEEQYDRVCGLARQGAFVASRHKVQAAG